MGATPETVDAVAPACSYSHVSIYLAAMNGHASHAPGSGHASDPGPVRVDTDRRWLVGALVLITSFMAAEVVVGFVVNSIALLSDAAHMLTDAAALALALVALQLAKRPPSGGYTYGLRRAEILSAQANGITLIVLAAWLGYEAVLRLTHPEPVRGLPMLLTALAGVVVNLVATWLIGRADRRSLNIEGAYRHILTDLAAFIATAVAGVIILLTGFRQADSLASLAVVALMVQAGVGLVRDSGRILLEAAPAGIVPERVGHDLAGFDGVIDVHDLHVWEITSGSPALSAHVIVRPALDCHQLRLDLEELLRERYHLTHTTLQVDHAQPTVHWITRG
jgi:cobalt-zinc-cadmium efflux system protein